MLPLCFCKASLTDHCCLGISGFGEKETQEPIQKIDLHRVLHKYVTKIKETINKYIHVFTTRKKISAIAKTDKRCQSSIKEYFFAKAAYFLLCILQTCNAPTKKESEIDLTHVSRNRAICWNLKKKQPTKQETNNTPRSDIKSQA